MLASLVIKLEYSRVLSGRSAVPAVPACVCSTATSPLEPSQQLRTETSHVPSEINRLVTYRNQTPANCSNRQQITFCNTLNLQAKTVVALLAVFTVSLFSSASLGARSLRPLASARVPPQQ